MENFLQSLSSQTPRRCVDLIEPYTLRGKDGTEIDFMCLTMINPASSWSVIVELLATTDLVIPMDTKGCKGTKTHKQLNWCTLTNHLQ